MQASIRISEAITVGGRAIITAERGRHDADRRTVASLRKAGFDARYLAGGHLAWKAIKGPLKLFDATSTT